MTILCLAFDPGITEECTVDLKAKFRTYCRQDKSDVFEGDEFLVKSGRLARLTGT
jgi:hypothetical protein